MKKRLTKAVFILLALGLAMPAFARSSLHAMERNQAHRIQQGIHSGELTRKEAKVLRKEQSKIRHLKRRYLRDGRFSKRERRSLRNRYAKAGQHIYRLTHNSRTNYRYGYDHRSPWSRGNHGSYSFFFRP